MIPSRQSLSISCQPRPFIPLITPTSTPMNDDTTGKRGMTLCSSDSDDEDDDCDIEMEGHLGDIFASHFLSDDSTGNENGNQHNGVDIIENDNEPIVIGTSSQSNSIIRNSSFPSPSQSQSQVLPFNHKSKKVS